jgi:hypothetical protein
MTPFNLGDVYEFGGGVLMAYCCLRTIAAAPPAGAFVRLQGSPVRRSPGGGPC